MEHRFFNETRRLIMEIKKFDIDNRHIEFVNQSVSTRNGFKHMTTMFVNGCERGTNTVHYLNRTWEHYRYQTVMRGCVQKLIEIRIENLKSTFKNQYGYSRMTAKRNEEFERWMSDDSICKFYNKLLKKIGA